MSTRLHNGYRFAETDFFALHETLMQFQERIVADRLLQEQRLVAKEAVQILDRLAVQPVLGTKFEHPHWTNLFWVAWHTLEESWKETLGKGYRCPGIDFQCDVLIFAHEGRFYGLLYSERNEWEDWFCKLPSVEPFGYWDNTDPPDGTTDAEWAERGKLWNTLLGPTGAPAHRSMSLNLSRADDRRFGFAFDTAGFIAQLPSFEQRVRWRAVDGVRNRKFAELGTEADRKDLDAGFRLAHEAQMYMQTKKAKREVAVLSEELRLLMNPTPADELLNYKPPIPVDISSPSP